MNLLLLGSIVLLLVVSIAVITWFSKRSSKKKDADATGAREPEVRRAAVMRGIRQRRGRVVGALNVNQEHQNDLRNNLLDDDHSSESKDLSKLGTKKRAKLEAKAERKVQREIEERDQEERRKQDQRLQEERDKERDRVQQEEKRLEEAEKSLREEKERQEHEEYMKLKEAFSVEEEGFEEKPEYESKNLLREFIEHVKSNKVVILEDLARHFELKTISVIERVQRMQMDGILSGVIDDRGKFIYISQEELEAVAKFVKQRGRISISELAQHSNYLINLKPLNPCASVEA